MQDFLHPQYQKSVMNHHYWSMQGKLYGVFPKNIEGLRNAFHPRQCARASADHGRGTTPAMWQQKQQKTSTNCLGHSLNRMYIARLFLHLWLLKPPLWPVRMVVLHHATATPNRYIEKWETTLNMCILYIILCIYIILYVYNIVYIYISFMYLFIYLFTYHQTNLLVSHFWTYFLGGLL